MLLEVVLAMSWENVQVSGTFADGCFRGRLRAVDDDVERGYEHNQGGETDNDSPADWEEIERLVALCKTI